MPEISIETTAPDLTKPSESGEDARNIINEHFQQGPRRLLSNTDKMMAAIALALLDVADAIRNS